MKFNIGDTIRVPGYLTCGGWRMWKIQGQYLGGLGQESTYELIPLDMSEAEHVLHVPCILLENNPLIDRV